MLELNFVRLMGFKQGSSVSKKTSHAVATYRGVSVGRRLKGGSTRNKAALHHGSLAC